MVLKPVSIFLQKESRPTLPWCFQLGKPCWLPKQVPPSVSLYWSFGDISTDGLNLISEIRLIYDNYEFDTQILAASVRHTMHIIDCAKLGSDVMTGPLSAIEGLLKHPLTDIGLAKFLADYKKGN